MDIPPYALTPADRGRLAPPHTTSSVPELSEAEVRTKLEHELLRMIRSERFGERSRLRCPHCYSDQVVKWGTFSGRQRYRCKSCERTFSDLTKTPLWRTKKLDLWAAHGRWMALGASVRRIASALEINKDTALRWRHRIALAYDQMHGGPTPESDLALAPLVQRVSDCGRQPRGRPSRSTGRYPYLGLAGDREQVWLLFMAGQGHRDRGYQALRMSTRRPTAFHWRRALGPLLTRPTDLNIRGGETIDLRMFSLREGHRVRDPLRNSGPALRRRSERRACDDRLSDGVGMLRRAESHRSSWRRWLYRFRGVATRHTRLYLAWHHQLLEVLDSPEVPADSIEASMLAPALTPPSTPWWPPGLPSDREWFDGGPNSSLGQSSGNRRVAPAHRPRLAVGVFDDLLRPEDPGLESDPVTGAPPPHPSRFWDSWWRSLTPRKIHRMSLDLIDEPFGTARQPGTTAHHPSRGPGPPSTVESAD